MMTIRTMAMSVYLCICASVDTCSLFYKVTITLPAIARPTASSATAVASLVISRATAFRITRVVSQSRHAIAAMKQVILHATVQMRPPQPRRPTPRTTMRVSMRTARFLLHRFLIQSNFPFIKNLPLFTHSISGCVCVCVCVSDQLSPKKFRKTER